MTYEERIEVLKETAMRKDILIFPEIRAVFAYLCSAATDYHDAANVNSVRLISEFTGLTKYRVRKVINCLRDLGLVERTTCGFPAYEWSSENGKDFTESHPPVNGFGLTKKGFESATYKKADELQEAEYRRLAEMSDDMYIIEDTKVADVQPVKHGRWITWDDSGFTKCSCCNSEYYIADLQTVGDSEGFVNFCPNCGARMDLGDEKNE